jgi:hypothetical protein
MAYADDLAACAETKEELAEIAQAMVTALSALNICISPKKFIYLRRKTPKHA